MSELLDEFVAATADVRRGDFDLLEAAGVPRSFLWHGPMRFGISVVAPNRDGTYELLDGGGELAFIVPAIPLKYDDEEIGDLVAFRLSQPGRWWTRRASAPFLNPLAVHRSEIMREPLTVLSSPLAWLRGAGEGLVILDWSVNLRFHLGGVERIGADTVALGDRLDRKLREPAPRPAIYVPEAA